MNKYIKHISFFVLTIFLCTSCLNDLDTEPLNERILVSTNVYKSAEAYRGVLAKCYGSLILNGQNGDGDGDIGGMDSGYSGYTRSLFYMQECASDVMALHAGSSQNSRNLLLMNWTPATSINSYVYYRLYMVISYCNEFLRESSDDMLKKRNLYDELKNDMPYYRAEARFLRAYAYSMVCDLYGSGPFVDETMSVGTIPRQKTREEIYNYAVAEAEAIKDELTEPGANQYGRIDRVSAWFLLARIYLNAETWVGKKEYEKAYQYAKKVIDEGGYPLASDYRHIFLADNDKCSEIIWKMPQHHAYTTNSSGTNALIKILVGGTLMKKYAGMKDSWGSARLKTQMVDKFAPEDQLFDENDPWGDKKKDKRAQFFTIDDNPNDVIKRIKETWVDGKGFTTEFKYGYVSLKWRNLTQDRKELEPGGSQYSSIDYPMFRTADAYLMAAEAILRGASGTRSQALAYVNEIRDRAYMSGAYGNGVSGRINDSQLTLDFLLDERARELYTESIRRTDLIRFGKYTKGYNWDWKGGDGGPGEHIGKDVDDKYKLYPIPQNEFTVNPYLTQNPDYSK